MKFLLSFVGRYRVSKLVVVSFILSALDLVGIAAIFPYLKLITSPDSVTSRGFAVLRADLGITGSALEVALTISLLMAAFFSGKALLTALLNKYQLMTFADVSKSLSELMFGMILKARYAMFLRTSTSELVGMVPVYTQHAGICLQSWTVIFNEGLFMVLLMVGLLAVSPTAATIAVLLMALGAPAMYWVVVRRMTFYGEQQKRLDKERHRLSFATVAGIKDIKIMGLETSFNKKNSELAEKYGNLAWRYGFVQSLPKITIEYAVIIAFILVGVVIVLTGKNTANLTPLLGTMALAGLRVVPGFSRILNSYNGYRYSKELLRSMVSTYQELKLNNHSVSHVTRTFNESIELRGICFNYEAKKILSDINLRIAKGSSVGIVGQSGSGKSTLLDLITGLQKADSGTFLIDGREVDPYGTDVLKSRLGYVPQHVTLLDETIAFNIAFASDYDPSRLEQALKIARLDNFVGHLPDGVAAIVGENGVRLSGGQRQRLGIARAVYGDPEIILLDEATSSLDAIVEAEFVGEIAGLSKKKTLIIVAHRLSTVKNCNAIYVMDRGQFVARGTHAELLDNCALYRELARSKAS